MPALQQEIASLMKTWLGLYNGVNEFSMCGDAISKQLEEAGELGKVIAAKMVEYITTLWPLDPEMYLAQTGIVLQTLYECCCEQGKAGAQSATHREVIRNWYSALPMRRVATLGDQLQYQPMLSNKESEVMRAIDEVNEARKLRRLIEAYPGYDLLIAEMSAAGQTASTIGSQLLRISGRL